MPRKSQRYALIFRRHEGNFNQCAAHVSEKSSSLLQRRTVVTEKESGAFVILISDSFLSEIDQKYSGRKELLFMLMIQVVHTILSIVNAID